MKVLIAQLGARRHYAVARALHRLGCLERLVTDACVEIPPWKWLNGPIPSSWQPAPLARLLGRRVREVPAEKIEGFPLFALSSLWSRRGGLPRNLSQTDRWARRNADFGKLVAGKGFGAADTVYAYNGAALEIFRAARREGLRAILDQTAAPWRWNRALLEEEARRWPGWEERPAELDASGALSAREEAEWGLADRIVCGSEFVVSALAEMENPRELCRVVPYPRPLPEGRDGRPPAVSRPRRAGEPLHVLFVGTLQLRKGIAYLLEARRLLRGENVTFRLVGPSLLSEPVMKELRAGMEVVGAAPRSEVAGHYAWAHVFVLPTLSEGSANVCLEAMAAGLPVITTPNAGVGIEDGRNGLLVPIRDPQALAAAIWRLAENEALRERLSSAGAGIGSFAQPFTQYAEELRQAISTARGAG